MSKDKFKRLDLETSLEQFFFGMAALGFLLLATGIAKFFYHGMMLSTKYFLGIGIVLLPLFYILRRNVDNYYILDAEQNALFYHFQLFSYKSLKKCVEFSEIAGVTVSGRKCEGEENSEWDYRVLMLDKSGKTTPLSNLLRGSYEENCKLAKLIAEFTGCNYFETQPEMITEVQKSKDGKFVFKFRKATASDSGRQGIVVFIIIVLTIALMAWLF